MKGTSRQGWLDTGLIILAEHGAPALTIDRLCEVSELTRGSFYHHFASMGRYKKALMDHWVQLFTSAPIDGAEADQGRPPVERLRVVLDQALDNEERQRPLEVAMRAWAAQDPAAMEVQTKIDAARIGYLRDLAAEAGLDRAEAELAATLLYTVTIGCAHLAPPLPGAQLRRLYDLILSLLPPPT